MSIDSLLRQIIIILLRFWLEISVNMQWIYDMPRICSEFAQNLLRICWESAENLLRIYSEFAENLIRNCWESAHNLQRICTDFAENLLRICWESAHCLLSICWDSAENLLRICWELTIRICWEGLIDEGTYLERKVVWIRKLENKAIINFIYLISWHFTEFF